MKEYTAKELIENIHIINDFLEADLHDNNNLDVQSFLDFSYQSASLNQFIKDNVNEDKNVTFRVHDNIKTYYNNLTQKELKHKLIEKLNKFIIITAQHEQNEEKQEDKLTDEEFIKKASKTFNGYCQKKNLEQAAEYIADIAQLIDIDEIINEYFNEQRQKELTEQREKEQREQRAKERYEQRERRKAKKENAAKAAAMEEQRRQEQAEQARRKREEERQRKEEELQTTTRENIEDFILWSEIGQTIDYEVNKGHKKVQYIIFTNEKIFHLTDKENNEEINGIFLKLEHYDNHKGAYIIEISEEHRTDSDFIIFKVVNEIFKNKELLNVILFKTFSSLVVNEDKTFTTCSIAEDFENM